MIPTSPPSGSSHFGNTAPSSGSCVIGQGCGFSGSAEYHTIASVKESVTIPVFANGDIDTPEKAARVLEETGADGVMLGRAALGRPWIFSRIAHYLKTGQAWPEPDVAARRALLLEHVALLHGFYGEPAGVRIARKHIGWYLKSMPNVLPSAIQRIYAAQDGKHQIELINHVFDAVPSELAA